MAERRKSGSGDAALWRAVTKDVKRIKRKPTIRRRELEEAPPAAPKETAAAKPARKAPARKPAPPAAPVAPPGPPLDHGRAAGVDRRTLDRLRRGRLAIEAEIDLHGHRQDEAHRALNAFVQGQAAAGRRVVRVVTGRGLAREGGGVLRTLVPRWLNEEPLRPLVLAFSHARPDDGGDGALYVLLRRRRDRPAPAPR